MASDTMNSSPQTTNAPTSGNRERARRDGLDRLAARLDSVCRLRQERLARVSDLLMMVEQRYVALETELVRVRTRLGEVESENQSLHVRLAEALDLCERSLEDSDALFVKLQTLSERTKPQEPVGPAARVLNVIEGSAPVASPPGTVIVRQGKQDTSAQAKGPSYDPARAYRYLQSLLRRNPTE